MAENLDLATSNLLCSENSNTCFDNSECNIVDESGILSDPLNIIGSHRCPSLDIDGSGSFPGFSVQSEETVRLMIEREKKHLPRDDYLKRLRCGDLDLNVRRQGLDWILKVGFLVFSYGVVGFCLFDY